MKKLKIPFIILMLLPMVATVVALFFLPDRIPAHFNVENNVTRYGSKYETLILPAVIVLMGLFLGQMVKVAKKADVGQQTGSEVGQQTGSEVGKQTGSEVGKQTGSEVGKQTGSEVAVYLCAIATLVVMNAMTGYFLYVDFFLVENLDTMTIDLSGLLYTILGFGLIVLGNFLPRVKRNRWFGVRTPWNQNSDKLWKKDQRFGGITMVVVGLLLIVGNLCFFSGLESNVFSLGILVLMAVVVTAYSYSKHEIRD